MKCIRVGEKIHRVSDESAKLSVESGRATFAKKEDFKIQERGSYVPGKQESTMSNVEKRKKGIYSKRAF